MASELAETVAGNPPDDTQARIERAAAERKAQIRKVLLTGPILPTMLKLGWPTMVVLIIQTVVAVAETYYVSFLGTAALAGAALVSPVIMLMVMMSNGGIGGGVSSAVARAIGSGRKHDADALVFHALILALILGAVFTAAAFIFGPALYQALGGSGPALDAAVTFSSYAFIGAIPAWIVNLMASAMRGAGNVRFPATVSTVGAAIMLPLSPAFIFGIGPVPRFGIAGAGMAVTLFNLVAALVILRYLISGRSSLVLRPARLEWRLFRDILRVGLISAIGTIQPNLTLVIVTGTVGLFGADALAGYGMSSRLDFLVTPLVFGLGTAVVTMIGTNMGAGDLARAKRIAWRAVLISAAFTETLGLIIAAFPWLWVNMFSNEAAVVATGTSYLSFVAPIYGAAGTSLIIYFAAQGGGRVIVPFFAGTARMLIAAGAGWFVVTHLDYGLKGLFAMVAVSMAANTLISLAALGTGAIWRKGAA